MAVIKDLFFDVDGTLVNPRTNEIDESTTRVIKALKEQGYRCYLSTGRSLGSLQPEIKDMISWDGFVLNNGQVVLDPFEQPISVTEIEKPLMKEIIEKANDLGIALLLQGQSWKLVSPHNTAVLEVFSKLNEEPLPYEKYNGDVTYTFMIFGHDYSILEEYPQLRYAKGHSSYADVMLDGFNKAVGIEKLNIQDYIAFGDSMNDLEMIKAATLSASMYESPMVLKEASTIHSTTTQDELEQLVYRLQLLK